jgi:hypothetical protein
MPAKGEHWMPCHPIDAKIAYEGKIWSVSEINLATGMHTIVRPPNLSKSDLRMMDLELWIDLDEEV